jgi:hypothetical protein
VPKNWGLEPPILIMRSRWSSVINDIKLLIEAIKKAYPRAKKAEAKGKEAKEKLKKLLKLNSF